MAVMTTQQPEGVAVEQKIQPVPSSDKMALDLDINGTSSRDETTLDPTLSDTSMTKPLEDSPSEAVTSKILEVNGIANDDAFSANQAIPTPPTEPAREMKGIEEIPASTLNSFLDTNTTTTEVQKLSISPDNAQQSEALLASVDSAIDTAMEDVAATSSVLPIVDTQESDIRNSESSPPPAAPPIPPKASLDLIFGDEPAQDPFSETSLQSGAAAQKDAQPTDSTFENVLPDLGQNPISDAPTQEVPEMMEMTISVPVEPEQSAPAGKGMADQPSVDDTSMHDFTLDEAIQQAQPTKIAREREEDDDDSQPSAKRTKTEEVDGSDAGLSLAEPYQNGDAIATPTTDVKKDSEEGDNPMTEHEAKEYIKLIRNATRTKNGGFLKAPVVELLPTLRDQYLAVIEQPIDLSTMEAKLKDRKYANLNALRVDINLLWSNSVKFNGDAHGVTSAAREVRNSLLHKVRNIPAEKLPAPKKEKKFNKATPTPDSASRGVAVRKPKVPAPRLATAQVAAQPAPTFALDPVTNTPLIRRDSTIDNERPHRKIQRPVKDLPYTASKPKNKKLATELKFCGEVLNEMKHKRHSPYSMPFMDPVDPVALNIPNYFTMIKTPMDIKTVSAKLNNGMYANAKDFEKDVRLIFTNCFKFNPAGNPVNDMGKSFLDVFNKEWDKKSDWIAEHSPPAASPSLKSDSDEDESEEEEEEHDEAAGSGSANTAAANRLIEEQKKLIQMMQKKPANLMDVAIQQAVVDSVQKIIDDSANTKKPKKTKAPKAKKPAAVKREKPAPKKPVKKKKEHLDYMGTVEKEVISNGLSSLPEGISNNVLDMIKADQSGVDVGDDGTLELDIDVVSAPVLWQIHALIMKHAPEVDAQVRAQFAETNAPRTLAKPAPKKKNKPMNAAEQEAKIRALKNGLGEFDRQGSGSQEPIMQTVEKHEPESSGDESDSEEE